METERRLETLRHRLLRLVTGLLAAVVFMSVGPFSSAVPRWVLSILSRAETAAQLMVIVQARIIAAQTGSDVDPERLLDSRIRDRADCESAASLSNLRERLEALRALLEDLPRHGLRLLRRTEKRVRRLLRAARTHHAVPGLDAVDAEPLCAWRFAEFRIERPPDKARRQSLS